MATQARTEVTMLVTTAVMMPATTVETLALTTTALSSLPALPAPSPLEPSSASLPSLFTCCKQLNSIRVPESTVPYGVSLISMRASPHHGHIDMGRVIDWQLSFLLWYNSKLFLAADFYIMLLLLPNEKSILSSILDIVFIV